MDHPLDIACEPNAPSSDWSPRNRLQNTQCGHHSGIYAKVVVTGVRQGNLQLFVLFAILVQSATWRRSSVIASHWERCWRNQSLVPSYHATRNKGITAASLLGARTLLGAPGLTTSNKKLLRCVECGAGKDIQSAGNAMKSGIFSSDTQSLTIWL